MPFRLCHAPETFQRLIERIFLPRIGINVLVYLDDILMFASNVAELVDIIHDVLQLLISSGIKCKLSKSALFTKRKLRHIVPHTTLCQIR